MLSARGFMRNKYVMVGLGMVVLLSGCSNKTNDNPMAGTPTTIQDTTAAEATVDQELTYQACLDDIAVGRFEEAEKKLDLLDECKAAEDLAGDLYYKWAIQLEKDGEYEKSIETANKIKSKYSVPAVIRTINQTECERLVEKGQYLDAFNVIASESISAPETRNLVQKYYNEIYTMLREKKQSGIADKEIYDLAYKLYQNKPTTEDANLVLETALYNMPLNWYDRENRELTCVLKLEENNSLSVEMCRDTDFIQSGIYQSTMQDRTFSSSSELEQGFHKILKLSEDVELNIKFHFSPAWDLWELYLKNGEKEIRYLSDDDLIGIEFVEQMEKEGNFITQETTQAIKNNPALGMTAEEVLQTTWGKPKRINKTTYTWGIEEQWIYPDNQYIYLENGIVVAISESSIP